MDGTTGDRKEVYRTIDPDSNGPFGREKEDVPLKNVKGTENGGYQNYGLDVEKDALESVWYY